MPDILHEPETLRNRFKAISVNVTDNSFGFSFSKAGAKILYIVLKKGAKWMLKLYWIYPQLD